MTKSKSKYVGVDGCPCGWISIGLNDGDCAEVKEFTEFRDLVNHYSAACLILVDMPIGLFEDKHMCWRDCDAEAIKQLCWPRSMSVFPVPSRHFVHRVEKGMAYSDGRSLSESLTGKNIPPGSFGITPKIAQVDKVMTGCDKPVREVHPEVCFWALNGKKAVSPKKIRSKINPDGMDERKRVLRHSKLQIDDIFKYARSKSPRKTAVGDDDILDALVAAVTAKLGCQDNDYELRTLPDDPPKDCKGLPMEMVYAIKKTA
jgi:predicted RNase H-like nuclease